MTHEQAPTRRNSKGFREALCPLCNSWIQVISYQDDTRWRYANHRLDDRATTVCVMSQGLLADARAAGILPSNEGKEER